MRKPRLLDLCCCAGGAAAGYIRAGFDVTGVDIAPQPRYPGTFIQADALTFPLEGFDAYHTSPPCQRFSRATVLNGTQSQHPDLIDPLRQRLHATGKPYIIENVECAPLRNPIKLCGTMFGLRVIRHRLFESNLLLFQPQHPDMCRKRRVSVAKAGAIAHGDEYWSICGHFGQKDRAQQAMGIDWMRTTYEIAQAIPPAYTLWIGTQVKDAVMCSMPA